MEYPSVFKPVGDGNKITWFRKRGISLQIRTRASVQAHLPTDLSLGSSKRKLTEAPFFRQLIEVKD